MISASSAFSNVLLTRPDGRFLVEARPKSARHWTEAPTFGYALDLGVIAADWRVSRSESELSDLFRRGLAGEAGAYRRFLDLLSAHLRGFFQKRLRNDDPSYAEDLVQETLIAIHLHRATYNPALPVTAWVYAIARYKLIDHIRRVNARGFSTPVDDVAGLFAEERADSAEPAHDLAALLGHLPAKQSLAIRLVKLDQLSVREAAARTGMSESDVKVSIHRGLRKLMALVGKGGSHED